MYYIGIDGGGTKTAALLCDEEGNVLAKALEGATNPTTVRAETVERRFQCLLDQLRESTDIHFQHVVSIFAGMSGYSRLTNEERLIGLLKNASHPNTKVTISYDAISALYSGTDGKPGIVNIAGTGSLTFGMNEKNITKRVGGWGYLLDHSGSGYGIGLAALKTLFYEHDYGKRASALSTKILTFFNVSEPQQLIPIIYDLDKSREPIASLAPLILDEAERKDEVALLMIDKACEEIVQSVKMVAMPLFDSDCQKEVPVVLVGGLMKRKDLFLPKLKQIWATEWLVPDAEPVIGSVIAAKKAVGKNDELDDFAAALKEKG
ncbi:N-acetylglucosamine kinase [Evansella halocellulosilytica]|uniref:N-acetylglucosamine kinase n=1 Tax=Evansella halocellulosilytica TaxID=2011013 RepID=UPI000BB7BD97|nr:BadF/BadG/BcrA/BcrD ATPase family protein [Evansella halocellulosilytica]